jgi:hypothetical protein
MLSKTTISMWGWYASNLAHLCWWKGENFGQRIWDKVKCYWWHLWGTHWKLGEHCEEPIENLGHIWEHDGNTRIKNFHPCRISENFLKLHSFDFKGAFKCPWVPSLTFLGLNLGSERPPSRKWRYQVQVLGHLALTCVLTTIHIHACIIYLAATHHATTYL